MRPEGRLKVYVIGLGDWVQFRATRLKLIATTSKLTKTIMVQATHLEEYGTQGKVRLVTRDTPTKHTIQQTVYSGGRVLGACSVAEYRKHVRGYGLDRLQKGGILELPPELARQVAKRSWRETVGII